MRTLLSFGYAALLLLSAVAFGGCSAEPSYEDGLTIRTSSYAFDVPSDATFDVTLMSLDEYVPNTSNYIDAEIDADIAQYNLERSSMCYDIVTNVRLDMGL